MILLKSWWVKANRVMPVRIDTDLIKQSFLDA